MAADQNPVTPEGPNSPWLGIVKFLFIAFFVVMVYLLLQTMVRDRFFRGGSLNHHDSTTR